LKLNNREFDRIVKGAVMRIPEEIRRHLENIVISVQKRPSPEILEEMGFTDEQELLGLFQGTARTERSITSPPLFPDTILLFQEPLENMCETVEELEEEIEITIVHEIAHALGMSEEKLAELGYE
jgi:predicted Zn-dependent protease with MMP-like domain